MCRKNDSRFPHIEPLRQHDEQVLLEQAEADKLSSAKIHKLKDRDSFSKRTINAVPCFGLTW